MTRKFVKIRNNLLEQNLGFGEEYFSGETWNVQIKERSNLYLISSNVTNFIF